MICFKNIFCYAGWKSLHIQTAINKLSGIYVFIICGRRRTIKLSSNHIPRSEGYVLTACQLMYLHTSAHRLLRYYTLCTVMFSHWCLRHEVIWQHCIQPSANTVSHRAAGLPLVCRSVIMCFGGGVALENDLQGGWDLVLSKLACYYYPLQILSTQTLKRFTKPPNDLFKNQNW